MSLLTRMGRTSLDIGAADHTQAADGDGTEGCDDILNLRLQLRQLLIELINLDDESIKINSINRANQHINSRTEINENALTLSECIFCCGQLVHRSGLPYSFLGLL